jgi:hypothetical protein
MLVGSYKKERTLVLGRQEAKGHRRNKNFNKDPCLEMHDKKQKRPVTYKGYSIRNIQGCVVFITSTSIYNRKRNNGQPPICPHNHQCVWCIRLSHSRREEIMAQILHPLVHLGFYPINMPEAFSILVLS